MLENIREYIGMGCIILTGYATLNILLIGLGCEAGQEVALYTEVALCGGLVCGAVYTILTLINRRH